jgi:hypothetical protein
MRSRRSFALVILPALALAGFALAQARRPGDQVRAKRDEIIAAIKKNAKLPKDRYWQHAEALRGGKSRKIAAVPLHRKDGGRPAAFTADKKAAVTAAKHALTVVGGAGLPTGFGSGFQWDRVDEEVLLVMFINAADPLGVSIDGLEAGDQVQVMAASGIASFSKDKGNPLASSIVGLVATGGKIAVTAKGLSEAVPAIDAAEKIAKDQFKATNSKRELRDAFGVEPSSGNMARQEGGLLVCLPEAGGTFYSGNNDHKDRWVGGKGERTDEHLPAHFNYNAFFPMRGDDSHNTRIVRGSGQMFVLAWDWDFEDNAGFYKVFVKLKKGNGLPQRPILRKQSQDKTPPKRPPSTRPNRVKR